MARSFRFSFAPPTWDPPVTLSRQNSVFSVLQAPNVVESVPPKPEAVDSPLVDSDQYIYWQGLISNLNELRKRQEKCDIILKVDDELFYCHSLVLISQTDYFKNLLTNKNFSEHNQEMIELADVDKVVFKKILDSFYGEPLDVKDDVVALIQLCDYLQLPQYFFRTKIENYLVSSFSRELAMQLVHLPCLKTSYLRSYELVINLFATDRKCKDIKEYTLDLSLEVFSDVLSSCKCDLDHLSELFWYCDHWIRRDPINRTKFINRLVDVIFKNSIADSTKKQKLRSRSVELIRELVNTEGASLNLDWLSLEDQKSSAPDPTNTLVCFTKNKLYETEIYSSDTKNGLTNFSWVRKRIQRKLPETLNKIQGVVHENKAYVWEETILTRQGSFYLVNETGACQDLQLPHEGITTMTCCRSMIYALYSKLTERHYGFYDTNINRWFYLCYPRPDEHSVRAPAAKEWIVADKIKGGLYSISHSFKEILYQDLRAGVWKKIAIVDSQPEYWISQWTSCNYYDDRLIISTAYQEIYTIDLRNERSYCNPGSKLPDSFQIREMICHPEYTSVTSDGFLLWFNQDIVREFDINNSRWTNMKRFKHILKPLDSQ